MAIPLDPSRPRQRDGRVTGREEDGEVPNELSLAREVNFRDIPSRFPRSTNGERDARARWPTA